MRSLTAWPSARAFWFPNGLGWLIFLAILLHKAPEGFTMASVMLASGRSSSAALTLFDCIGGGSTLAGVLVIELVPSWLPYGLPLSAGVASLCGRQRPGARSEPRTGDSHGAGLLCRRRRLSAAADAAARAVNECLVSIQFFGKFSRRSAFILPQRIVHNLFVFSLILCFL
jgi:hypothetical protein